MSIELGEHLHRMVEEFYAYPKPACASTCAAANASVQLLTPAPGVFWSPCPQVVGVNVRLQLHEGLPMGDELRDDFWNMAYPSPRPLATLYAWERIRGGDLSNERAL